jgi:nucleoside-diphosphate-sugar epimerase
MPKVAVLGANGQVGAELCLLLARTPEVDLVPIARNRSGSAFLRWHGIRCRHGRPAVAAEAPGLLADCDVVVNSALASGTPAQMRRTEDAMVTNAFACSRPGATIIHFSTQNVYGDPTRDRMIRWRSLYGRAKLATEARVLSRARRTGKPAYILRLGHVCGALQQISHNIRQEITENRVVLPDRDMDSNTVYTATIVDALLSIIRRKVRPGTYDLMNVPQWTWRTVYEYEARATGYELNPTIVASPAAATPVLRRVIRGMADVAGASFARQLAASALARLPPTLSERGQAWWYRKRARSEIASVFRAATPTYADHLAWRSNGGVFIPALMSTELALANSDATGLATPEVAKWSEDLRLADVAAAGAATARESTP